MKYRRLKTLDSTGVPVMRYYKLADGEDALCNCFYKIVNGEAVKIEGEKTGAALVGFSHGGNNLAKGLMLLDINETPLYMGILGEDEETRPAIGDLVNGYQRVVDTHYDGDEGVNGKNDYGWGVEDMDNPYYIFHIEQNMYGSGDATVDDEDAGEKSPIGGSMEEVITSRTYTVTFNAQGGEPTPEAQEVKKGRYATEPDYPTKSGYGFSCWSLDPEDMDDTNAFVFESTPITEDITLYAIWVQQ